jgi:hypothetical protein
MPLFSSLLFADTFFFWKAERKIVTIYEAVRDSVPWDVVCVRTKHTISIHCEWFVVSAEHFIHKIVSTISVSQRPDCSSPLQLSRRDTRGF